MNKRTWLLWLAQWNHNENGGTGILMLGMIFLTLLLTPFLMDIGSVAVERQRAQTAADAGVMACAVELAETLRLVMGLGGGASVDEGTAKLMSIEVAEGMYIAAINAAAVGLSPACYAVGYQYARNNLEDVANWTPEGVIPSGGQTQLKILSVQHWRVAASLTNPADLLTGSVTSEELQLPADAAAEIYADADKIDTDTTCERVLYFVVCTTLITAYEGWFVKMVD